MSILTNFTRADLTSFLQPYNKLYYFDTELRNLLFNTFCFYAICWWTFIKLLNNPIRKLTQWKPWVIKHHMKLLFTAVIVTITTVLTVLLCVFVQLDNHELLILYSFISSAYLFLACIDGIQEKSLQESLKNFVMFLVLLFCLFNSFSLLVLAIHCIRSIYILIEIFLKIRYTYTTDSTKYEKDNAGFLLKGFYIATLAIFIICYFYALPQVALWAILRRINEDKITLKLTVSCLLFILWYGLELYDSIFAKFVYHGLYHNQIKVDKKDENDETANNVNQAKEQCNGPIWCFLLFVRTDDAYILTQIRAEIKQSEMEMIAKRKPKNKNMVIQTLKCMMAIKRKLRERQIRIAANNEESETDEENNESDSEQDSSALEENMDTNTKEKISGEGSGNKNDTSECSDGDKPLNIYPEKSREIFLPSSEMSEDTD